MLFTQQQPKRMAEACATKIAQALTGTEYFDEPYKYIVIEDFFDKELADYCLQNFPSPGDACWEHTNDIDIEVKLRTTWKSEFDIPETIVDAVRILNFSVVLKAMGERLGIPKLLPDPYFTGGGLNVTMRGGMLDVHVDGNYHDATGLTRRINAIVYLNPEWLSDWGGEFGIYDKTGEICLKKVPPMFNRVVIFDAHDFSFHGLPDLVNFPEGEPRRSIILYYYTKEPRPAGQVAVPDPHSALWKKRDFHDKRGQKTRAFK